MPRRQRSTEGITEGIIATITAVRALVYELKKSGRTPALKTTRLRPGSKRRDLRAAPSFIRGRNIDYRGAVLYTTQDIAEALAEHTDMALTPNGRNGFTPSPLIRVALDFLEFEEEHPIEAALIMRRLQEHDPACHTAPLLRLLRERRKELSHPKTHVTKPQRRFALAL